MKNQSLDKLAGSARRGRRVGLEAINNAKHDDCGLGAKPFIDSHVLKGASEREKARIRAKRFRAAKRTSKREAESLSTGFGNIINLIVVQVVLQKEATVSEAA